MSYRLARTYFAMQERYISLSDWGDILRRRQTNLMAMVSVLVFIVIAVELLKARYQKFYIVLAQGDEVQQLYATRQPRDAMRNLARLAAKHSIPPKLVVNQALTRLNLEDYRAGV